MTTVDWVILLVVLALLLLVVAARPRSESRRRASERRLDMTARPLVAPVDDAPRRSAANPLLWSLLTKREKEVANLAARGLSDAEIAHELSIAEKTVGNHLAHIYDKLQIHSRREIKYVMPWDELW